MSFFLLMLALGLHSDVALRFTNRTRRTARAITLPSRARNLTGNGTTKAAGMVKNVYFMHLPKCAGSSFTVDMPGHLDDATHMKSEEGCWGDSGGRRIFTMLREPRAHVLSMYFHCRTSEDHEYGHPYMPDEFVKWLELWNKYRRKLRTGPTPFCCYRPDNLQTSRYLCGGDQKPKLFKQVVEMQPLLNSTAFAELMYRFKHTAFVGLVEAYPESLCLLHIQERKEFPAECECTLDSNIGAGHSNGTHGTKAHKLSDYPSHVIDMIDNITVFDRALYNLAKQRFLREVRTAEKRYGKRLLCRHIGYHEDVAPQNLLGRQGDEAGADDEEEEEEEEAGDDAGAESLEGEPGDADAARGLLELPGARKQAPQPPDRVTGEPDHQACLNWMIKATNMNLTVPHPA